MSTRAYREGLEACGLKAGDFARIIRTARQNELGWEGVEWGKELDALVGQSGRKIKQIDSSYGMHLEGTNVWCPYFVLEKTGPDGNPLQPNPAIITAEQNQGHTVIVFGNYATLIGRFSKDELEKIISQITY